MATLAISLAGAAATSYLGLGASLGFTIGSVAASLLFPPDPVVIEGPRLRDLSVSASTYGLPIPRAYGTIRMPGNMIWSSGIDEDKHKDSAGGKGGLGGGGATQVTYTYSASWAMAFAEGEAEDVLRIWFDSKLVYDKTGASETVRKDGLSFRFYRGSETQLPDALIEADKGEGEVSAHRGLVYIVFDSVQLEDYGNRIPNVTAEIAFRTQGTSSSKTLASSDWALGMAVDWTRRRIFYTTFSGGGTRYLVRMDLDAFTESRRAAWNDLLPSALLHPVDPTLTVGPYSGYLYSSVASDVGSTISQAIVKVDPAALSYLGHFGSAGVGTTNSDTGFSSTAVMCELMCFDPTAGRKHFLFVCSEHENLGLLNADTMAYVWHDNDSVTSSAPFRGAVSLPPDQRYRDAFADDPAASPSYAVGYAVQDAAGNGSSARLWRISVFANATAIDDGAGGLAPAEEPVVNLDLVATFPASTWNSGAGVADFIYGPVLDLMDGGLIFIKNNRSATDGAQVWKWTEDDGIVWSTDVDGLWAPEVSQASTSTRCNGTIGWAKGGSAVLLDTLTGEILYGPADMPGVVVSDDLCMFDSASQSVIFDDPLTRFAQVYLDRAQGLGVALDDVVEDIASLVGFTPASDLVTSELASDTVRGYAITRRVSARKALEPLAQAYFFDGFESEGKIKFRKRNASPADTIAEGDLTVIDNQTGELLLERRTQEVELPELLTVLYSDKEIDYQQNAEPAKRIRQPRPTMYSRDPETIELPLVLTATEAAQIGEKMLFTIWSERTSPLWRSHMEFLLLEPGDNVTISLDDGTTLTARLAKVTLNADFSVSFEAVTTARTTYSSDTTQSAPEGVPQKVPPGPLENELFLLDIPLLRDIDSLGQSVSRAYFGLGGYQDAFPGGALWRSATQTSFANTGEIALTGLTWGVVKEALPDTDRPFATDEETELTVFLQSGELASCTTDEYYNNANVALIGAHGRWEVVAFRDAVENADGSYTVSHITRGRRNTDVNVGTHQAGDTFIFLESAALEGLQHALAELDTLYYYKGVSKGALVADARVDSITWTGLDLKPYAPVKQSQAADGSGGQNLTFERRTRLGWGIRTTAPFAPLSEESESYEIDIKDGPGGTVLRTLTGSSTTINYSAANITTDFGSAPANLTWEVFQMSDAVGRGVGREVTLAFAT